MASMPLIHHSYWGRVLCLSIMTGHVFDQLWGPANAAPPQPRGRNLWVPKQESLIPLCARNRLHELMEIYSNLKLTLHSQQLLFERKGERERGPH